MALNVEDGSIVTGAESFISVADASTYHSNRGNAAWAALASDTVREQCLRKATDYMEQTYKSRWQGYIVDEDQSLSWPRYDVYVNDYLVDDNIVPEIVKRACAELALKAATDDLMPDLTQGVLSETVGPISVSYDKSSPQSTRFKAIDAMLEPYLSGKSSGVNMSLVRA